MRFTAQYALRSPEASSDFQRICVAASYFCHPFRELFWIGKLSCPLHMMNLRQNELKIDSQALKKHRRQISSLLRRADNCRGLTHFRPFLPSSRVCTREVVDRYRLMKTAVGRADDDVPDPCEELLVSGVRPSKASGGPCLFFGPSLRRACVSARDTVASSRPTVYKHYSG